MRQHPTSAPPWGTFYDALGTLRSINEQMEDIFSQLDAVLSSAQQSAEQSSSAPVVLSNNGYEICRE